VDGIRQCIILMIEPWAQEIEDCADHGYASEQLYDLVDRMRAKIKELQS
jgi:hypothetical protein